MIFQVITKQLSNAEARGSFCSDNLPLCSPHMIYDEEAGKGQLISKCPFGIFNSPKKRTKKSNFTTIVPQVELFSFVFFWRIEDAKKTFRNEPTFSHALNANSLDFHTLQTLFFFTF